MKKLVLAAAVLIGGLAASQAGVDVHIGVGFRFPQPERVIISRPAPVIVSRAPVCAPAPVVVAPVCRDPYLAPAPVVVVPGHGHGHYSHRYVHNTRGWDRHDRGDYRRYDYRGSNHGHSSHRGHGGYHR